MANVNKCSQCGLRIRSPIEAHNSGPHHLRRDPHVTGAKLTRARIRAEKLNRPSNVGDPGSNKKGKD